MLTFIKTHFITFYTQNVSMSRQMEAHSQRLPSTLSECGVLQPAASISRQQPAGRGAGEQ